MQKREVTIDSYSESISSDESSNDKTVTADSDISAHFIVLKKHLVNGRLIQKELRLPFTR